MNSLFKNIVICGLLLAIGLSWQIKNKIYQAGSLQEKAFVVISRGAGTGSAALALDRAGVIDNPLLFKIAARIFGLDKKLKAGEYEFEKNISLYNVLQKLASGDILYRKITLAEGLTSKQMLDVINADDLLSGDITLSVREGELLPETYSFMRGDSKDSIILQAKKAMQTALDDAWDNRQDDLPIKNKAALLTLASIIEKETSLDEERELVASVFVNRLIKGMKLQTDPTVIYALTNGKKDLGRLLTRKDLSFDSPYNTYKYYGLPPAPICNPGKASLQAAANPEASSYLYFVASGNGGHNFSTSLKEHNKNVRNWKKKKK